jgi:hypothetical protein
MGFTEVRQQLKGQLAEIEDHKKILVKQAKNALFILTQKVNPYVIDILDLDEESIESAAIDLKTALTMLREAQGHIDNIKHQLNG